MFEIGVKGEDAVLLSDKQSWRFGFYDTPILFSELM